MALFDRFSDRFRKVFAEAYRIDHITVSSIIAAVKSNFPEETQIIDALSKLPPDTDRWIICVDAGKRALDRYGSDGLSTTNQVDLCDLVPTL